jgi:hypothetical protein
MRLINREPCDYYRLYRSQLIEVALKTFRMGNFHLLLLAYLSLCSTSFSTTDSPNLESPITGYTDHIVVTLASEDFSALSGFMNEEFPNAWKLVKTNNGLDQKGFLMPSSAPPYVEFWNAGIYFRLGDQIALGSDDTEARKAAIQYYANQGKEWDSVELFTVGSEGTAGHPYVGTFFVDYGYPYERNAAAAVDKLVGLMSAVSPSRTGVKEDLEAFGFALSPSEAGFIAVDSRAFPVYFAQLPQSPSQSAGHVALIFKILEAKYPEKKVIPITDLISAIVDGKDFVIVLNNNLYRQWQW